ncbi:VOC family protein [Desertihabitans aurantiacus]|uniref:VOC family protein n=1 Tax=Desertihabitans aurantiacus TaxID=2282477 RepID=UPI000DF82AE2|nr:VOC family protein [Desertihabitans aurantiacus]
MSRSTVIAMPTTDRVAAHAFYGAGLGLPTPGPLAGDGVPEPLQVELGEGCRLMLVPPGGFGWMTPGRTAAGPGTVECLLSLPVDAPADVDALVERARAAGAEVVAEPADQSWGYCATVADPDGHLLQVIAEPAAWS